MGGAVLGGMQCSSGSSAVNAVREHVCSACYCVFEETFSFPHESRNQQFAFVVLRWVSETHPSPLRIPDMTDVLDMNQFYLCGATEAGLVHSARPAGVTGVVYLHPEHLHVIR